MVSQTDLGANGVGIVRSDKRAADTGHLAGCQSSPEDRDPREFRQLVPGMSRTQCSRVTSIFAQRLMRTWRVRVLQKQGRRGAERERDWFKEVRLCRDTPQQAALSGGPGDPLS